MQYPVMTERQLAARWKISLKTLRRWRTVNEGPVWHKLFQHVRYHEADVLEFERRGTQHWAAILDTGERVPKVVTRPPKEQTPTALEEVGTFWLTAQEVIEATALPKLWIKDAKFRAIRKVPHRTLVSMVRFSLEALWQWEQANSVVGRTLKPEAPLQPEPEAETSPPTRVPRWHELARELVG